MSLLDLSNTTLLFVETRAHKITKRVIEDCLSKADFWRVLVYTDNMDKIGLEGVTYIGCPDFPNKKEAGAFYYGKAMEGVNSDFALMLEWDGGIFDPSKWRNEFFDYDYIGAPWVPLRHRPHPHVVGNGGFTLMSRKLGHFAVKNFHDFPVYTDMDFCRTQRPIYEGAGFKWPTAELASYFAWELGPRNPNHFGYHGAFTWPWVLPREEVITRAKLMLETPYLTEKSRQLFSKAPWLFDELTPDEINLYQRSIPPGHNLRPNIPIGGGMTPQQRALLRVTQAQRRGHRIISQTGDKA